MKVREIFEAELRRRGLAYSIDVESGRHEIEVGEARILVSLENLEREVALDGDESRVHCFVDAVQASAKPQKVSISREGLYWCLERSDHAVPAEIRSPVSKQLDGVLCHWSEKSNLISWVDSSMLAAANLTQSEAETLADRNLGSQLAQATPHISDVGGGVVLGALGSRLPFKAALMLAPNAREVLEPLLGWPLLAVIPDRNFLYFWAEKHEDFIGRMGPVVIKEFQRAPYPLSTEVFRLSHGAVDAIGAF